MNMHLSRQRKRSISRWVGGICATVVAGLLIAGALGIQDALIAQVRAQASTTARIHDLTVQVHELRSELAAIPNLRDRVSHLESEHKSVARRVTMLEDRRQ